jgi:hypothetical protein
VPDEDYYAGIVSDLDALRVNEQISTTTTVPTECTGSTHIIANDWTCKYDRAGRRLVAVRPRRLAAPQAGQ